LTRRTLLASVPALVSSRAAAAQGQSAAAAPYGGALAGLESRVEAWKLDPATWTRLRDESALLKMSFRAARRKEADEWKKKLREKLIELLGGFPHDREPLNPALIEQREFPSYRREKYVFASRQNESVFVYLLTPAGRPPFPGILCIPGHGRGADELVGIDEQGQTSPTAAASAFALRMVEQGAVAVAIEPIGFGCRRDPATKKKGPSATSCDLAAPSALLFGETILGWRVYDLIRTLDWMDIRPEINSNRIGCAGVEAGGAVALFSAALDARIHACLVSSYLNTFRDSILAIPNCVDQYVPGILDWAEMFDIAGLIAPRPLFIESGSQDPQFPIASAKSSFAKVQKIYEIFDAADKLQQDVWDGASAFNGKQGIPFLLAQLPK